MQDIHASDLKTILHSKRANLYYLEHCRVLVNGGRVEYVTEKGKQSLYWNIPIANTTTVLLGTGTSLTQAAMRELAKAGVLVGFCGGPGGSGAPVDPVGPGPTSGCRHHRLADRRSPPDQAPVQAGCPGQPLWRLHPQQARRQHRCRQPVSGPRQLLGVRFGGHRHLGAGPAARAGRAARQNTPSSCRRPLCRP